MTALSDLRRNPIDGSISWRNMDIEGHTVTELDQLPGIYGFRLQDRPRNTGLVVAETGTGGATAFTLVTTTPTGANQAFIDYDSGLVIVHSVHNGDFLEVTYQGAGSNVTVDLISDGTDEMTAKGDLITRSSTDLAVQAAGADGTFIGYDSSQSTGLKAFAGPTGVRLNGCVPTNNAGDLNRDLDFSAGFIFGTDGKWYTMAARTGKQLDATFVQGDSAGGLDTGAIATNTFYYPHAIIKDSDGSTDWLLSTSQSSPTVPSGWTKVYSATEWFFRTDGSSNIRGMLYHNDGWMYWKTLPQLDLNSGSITTARTTFAILAPTGIRWKVETSQYVEDGSSNVKYSNPDITDAAPSVSAVPLLDIRANTSFSQAGRYPLITDASAQLSVRASASTDSTVAAVNGLKNLDKK